jgi:NodT family efflux transporter outer membrane factor (OMF) lipoprotein
MRSARKLGFVLLALGAARCTVGPDFHAPNPAAALAWGAEPTNVSSVTTAAPVDPSWWQSFNDPELDRLIARLVLQNLDLAEAAERIRQAADESDIARSQGLPQIDAESSAFHERQSPQGFVSLVEPSPSSSFDYDIWTNGLSASWELDLFGRVRRAVEARRANELAMIEARHAVALDVLASLAGDYMRLRGTQARERIATGNLVVAQQSLALIMRQYRDGVSTTLATAQARAQVAQISSTIPPLETLQSSRINAIGLLLAEPPRALEPELAPAAALPAAPPVVPVGLPADLVRRRPDVREAEARLHEATAETGVAVADFYPDISLTGSFDMQGRMLVNAFSLADRAFTAGPTVDLPIFEGGRLRATLRLRRSQQREAAIAFENTVLQAWRDVDDALTAYAQTQRQRDDTASEVQQDRIALGAAEQDYADGAADFLNVDTAQQALLSSEDQLSQADTDEKIELVDLYKALGGGWEVADAPPGDHAELSMSTGTGQAIGRHE